MALLTASKIKYHDPSIVVTHSGTNTVLTGTLTTSTNAAVGDEIVLDIAGIRQFSAAVTAVTLTTITIAGTVIPAATYAAQEFDIIKTDSLTSLSDLTLRHSFDNRNEAAQAVVTINGGTNINYDISVKGVIDGIHIPTGSIVTPVGYGTTYVLTSA